jgi:hypothetical protein
MAKSNLMPLNTVIVGLGSAGWKSDLNRPTKGQSHTFSLLTNPNYEVIAGVDINSKSRADWQKNFKIPVFSDVQSAIASLPCDLVVVATPMTELFPVLKSLLVQRKKFNIIVEKPVLVNVRDFLELHQIASTFNNRILVNLPRLFSPEMTTISKYLINQHPEKVSGCYSGEYLNTCLHLITLVNAIYPECNWKLQVKDNCNRLQIYRLGTMIGVIEKSKVNRGSSFDLRIQTRRGILNYLEGGLDINFITANSELKVENTRDTYQKNVYDFISDYGWNTAISMAGLQIILPSIANLFGITYEGLKMAD